LLKSDSQKSLLGTSLGHFLNDGANSLFPVVYPVLLSTYHVSLEFIGIIAALYSLSSLAASPFVGRRSDYNESYPRLISFGLIVVAFGILGFTLSIVYFPGVPSFYLGLVLFTVLAGFGSSFYHPIAAAILNETQTFENRGRAMGINGAMGGVGMLAFPIITVGLIVAYGVWSLSLVTIAFILIAIAIYTVMTTVRAPEQIRNGINQKRSSSGVPMSIVLSSVLALTIVAFFRSAMIQGVINFMPTYLTTVTKIQYQYVGTAQIAFSFFAIVGQPVFGSLSDRYGRRSMIGVTLIGCVLSVLLLTASSTNFLLTEISLGLFGLFSYTGFPLFMGLTSLIAPKGGVTLANSIVWGFGTIGGGILGPILVGVLSAPSILGSLGLTFLFLTVLGMVSLVFMPFVPKRPKTAFIPA